LVYAGGRPERRRRLRDRWGIDTIGRGAEAANERYVPSRDG
jgi:hypothetical protein